MKLFRSSLLIAGLGFFSSVAMADAQENALQVDVDDEIGEGDDHEEGDHNHGDHGDVFDLDRYAVILEGTDLEGEACYLGVLAPAQVDEDNSYYKVETSFSHEGEGAGTLFTSLDADEQSLVGISQGGGSIVINLADSATTIVEAISYAVSFQHEGHIDRGFCENLMVFEDDHEGEDDDHDHDHDHQG